MLLLIVIVGVVVRNVDTQSRTNRSARCGVSETNLGISRCVISKDYLERTALPQPWFRKQLLASMNTVSSITVVPISDLLTLPCQRW